MGIAGAIAVPLCLTLLAVASRRVHSPKYWMVALGVIGLLVGIMLWISRGIASPISAAHQAMAMILLFVIPMSLGFAAAKAGALRERPWLAMIAVPLVFLAAVFVNMVVGASLGILQP